MEALDFVVLAAGGWIAVIALTMTLLTAASRADAAAQEPAPASDGPTDERVADRSRLPRMTETSPSGFRVGST